ncbi:MAG: anti-sigma factor family protein [Phycisphaerae bacterium]
MTCRHVAQLQDVYMDGELSPSLTAEVHAHLLQCPACQKQFEMVRACGEVVAKDCSEPELESGFAMRVLAALPKTHPIGKPVTLQTRRDQRQRFWRLAIGSSVPAAAALLFFSILIWPTNESAQPNGLVLGETREATDITGLEQVAGPTLDAFANTSHGVNSISQLVKLGVGEARRGVDTPSVEIDLDRPRDPNQALYDLLLDHLQKFLQPDGEKPVEGSPSGSTEEENIVRF